MWGKILLVLFVVVIISGVAIWRFPGSFLFSEKSETVRTENLVLQETEIQPTVVSEEKIIVEPGKQEEKISQSSLTENVPFTVQAPFGEWGVSMFQNGCEEAALVMAAYWVSEKPLTKEIAKQEIIALARFEDKKHGQSIDTSATDTEKLFKEYYNITASEVRTDITLTDIQETLATGALVIVPADGRKLMNPNYKQPGPTTHMLVVIGYDAEKKEFITHDSGTRRGQGYRYQEDILYEAIRDYPTGDHLPVKGIHKDMIVVKKP
ncbi:MAG: C39 family peptidase [bacterium]|nr:C39 family peptidase [bacterium]